MTYFVNDSLTLGYLDHLDQCDSFNINQMLRRIRATLVTLELITPKISAQLSSTADQVTNVVDRC